MIRTLVISEDSTLCYCLTSLFNSENTIEATFSSHDLDEISSKANTLQPDVALIDLLKLTVDEVRLIFNTLKSSSVITKSVLLAIKQDGLGEVSFAFTSGISGYICRGAPIKELIPAIKAVAAGLAVMEINTALSFSKQFNEVIEGKKVSNHHKTLTSRELEILCIMAEGHRDKEIARKLGLSPRTVRNHIANTMLKLGVDNRGQAIFVAVRENMIGTPVI